MLTVRKLKLLLVGGKLGKGGGGDSHGERRGQVFFCNCSDLLSPTNYNTIDRIIQNHANRFK
jgi:hypothetical protein